jgi:hypothetical protein
LHKYCIITAGIPRQPLPNPAGSPIQDNIHSPVCYYPPGTSKWNKIEYRMFSFVSMNGVLLESYATVMNLIAGTRSGLKVGARLDHKLYANGQKVTDDEWLEIPCEPSCHTTNPKWNWTIRPE